MYVFILVIFLYGLPGLGQQGPVAYHGVGWRSGRPALRATEIPGRGKSARALCNFLFDGCSTKRRRERSFLVGYHESCVGSLVFVMVGLRWWPPYTKLSELLYTSLEPYLWTVIFLQYAFMIGQWQISVFIQSLNTAESEKTRSVAPL